mgnify:CR=1 FL=1
MFGYDLGIDLGTTNIVIGVPRQGAYGWTSRPMWPMMRKKRRYCTPVSVPIS